MRWPHLSRRSQRTSRRRLRFEPLEDRRLLADLAIGVTLKASMDNDLHDSTINIGEKVGEFTLQIRVQDKRNAGEPTGVIALPLHVSWDPSVIGLAVDKSMNEAVIDALVRDVSTPPVTVTSNFPLQRSISVFAPDAGPAVPVPPPTPVAFLPFANLQGLRGAALPKLLGSGMAIGVNNEDVFSELRFRILSRSEGTRFTIRLAGSMSFEDASQLEHVVGGSNTEVVDAITVQTQLHFDPGLPSISGMKFNDQDMNGAKNDDEPGLGNWTIQLIRDQNNNGVLDVATDPIVATTTTSADGKYKFMDTEPGTYFVREVQQAGWKQTTPDPPPIVVAGLNVQNVDFGNSVESSSISGFVFADPNMNGTIDSGEDGLPNVTVQLTRKATASDPPETRTTLTGPDGWYHFENLAPGIYDVVEFQPPGFVNSLNSLGLVFPPSNDRRSGRIDGPNAFRDIDLREGEHAVDYNFGDNIIPTKRRFVASVDPFAETCALLKLNCVTVRGTTGNDQIEFVPDTEEVRVTVNNQPAQVFSRATVNIVKIDALAGQDTVTLRGSSAIDAAHSQSNSCTIQTGAYGAGDYAVLAVNAERTIVDGGLGDDLAVLRDSTVDDVLTATNDPFIGPVTELESALNMQRFVRAIAFERTRAVSIPNRGSDTATLNGLPVELVGDWSIIG
jgi:hypothetical protein